MSERGEEGTTDDRDINRTKVQDGNNNPDNELQVPGKPGKTGSKCFILLPLADLEGPKSARGGG